MEAEVTLEQVLGIVPPIFTGVKREVRLLTDDGEDGKIAPHDERRLRSWRNHYKRRKAKHEYAGGDHGQG